MLLCLSVVYNSFLFVVDWYYILWIYHNLSIYSPVDGHLGGFQVLLVQTKLLFVCKSLCGHMLLFLLGKYLGLELLGHRIGVSYVESAKQFSKVAEPFHTPTSSV